MGQSISTYTPSGNFDKYGGVELFEVYTSNGKWTYLNTNFNNAFVAGSSANIYPITISSS
jgi:hypothetical protein